MTFSKSIGDMNMYLGLFIDNRPNSRVGNNFQISSSYMTSCLIFILESLHSQESGPELKYTYHFKAKYFS